jgi:hypothetical protein
VRALMEGVMASKRYTVVHGPLGECSGMSPEAVCAHSRLPPVNATQIVRLRYWRK